MTAGPFAKPANRDFADPVVWGIAAATALLHLAVAGRYDFFRNELYFIVCGRHPDFGYVDQPPLVPLLAAATQAFGENLWLLRLPAVLAAAALVPVTAALARMFHDAPLSGRLAAVAAAIAPALLGITSTLGTPTFEPIGWTLCAYFLLRALMRDDPRALLWAALTAGISLEIKYGIAVWLVGLCIGALFTGARRIFSTVRFWIAAALAVLIAAPSAIWQAAHGWPFLDIASHHNVEGVIFQGSLIRFALEQVLAMNIAFAPLWLAGLIAPFAVERLRQGRIVAIAFVVSAVAIFLSHGKAYYLFPAYPALFAIGAAACARLNKWLAGAWTIAALALSLIALPIVLPVLSPAGLARYIAKTHLAPPPSEAASLGAPITQVFSDEFAWRDLERRVADIYRGLPPDMRAHAAILASNYGEAAAIDVYGRADNLPPALSGQNQYFLWGPRGFGGSVIIHVNGDPERWRFACKSVVAAGSFGAAFAMPYENNRPIFVCYGLSRPLSAIWPHLKRFS